MTIPALTSRRRSIVLFGAALLVSLTAVGLPANRADEPETVMVTLRARAGSEAEAARALAAHWETARRQNLVQESPHLTLRATDADKKAYFVEIFTWRDAAIPDAAPEAIRKIWDDMNKVAEARGGRPGLEISIVEIVGTK